MANPLLDIRGLSVSFPARSGRLAAVEDVDLAVRAGEVVGVVGESGSGKSLCALAAIGLAPPQAAVTATNLCFDGLDLRGLPASRRRRMAGREIAMVFQEPTASLNPCFTVGFQLEEGLRRHTGLRGAALRQRALELLAQVGVADPARRRSAFPHQMSGGMCQRVMIAMAISCNPRLLIADEPTTALDVTIQRQVFDLLLSLQAAQGMAMLLISHDIALVAEAADRIVVMYAGQVVEQGPADDVLRRPAHPYTAALLAAAPARLAALPPRSRLAAIPGQAPDLRERPAGCAFHPRCGYAQPRCRGERPAQAPMDQWRAARCHFPLTGGSSDQGGPA